MKKVHGLLIQKSHAYAKWHGHPRHKVFHWLALLAVVLVSTTILHEYNKTNLVAGVIASLESSPVATLDLVDNVKCEANNAATFINCINQVNQGTVNAIEVTEQIICSGANACRVTINNVTWPVQIYGRDNSSAGFKRSDSYNYNLLTVSNSSQVKIFNLIFDEDKNQDCDTIVNPTGCLSSIKISNSSDVTLDHLSFFYSKRFSVSLSKSQRVSITNSKFIGAGMFGVWMSTDQNLASSEIHIDNNLFKDIKSNAILFSAKSATATPSTIKSNLFIHNHRLSIFSSCGPSRTSPCPGGQIYLSYHNQNVTIEDNVVRDGYIENYLELNLKTSGIELQGPDTHYINIIGNDVHDNTNYGIVLDPNASTTDHVLIADNKLYKNRVDIGLFPPDPTVMTQSGNCFSPTCSLKLTKGSIYAEPNPCVIASGATTCTSKISWITNEATTVQVKTSTGGLFSSSLSASKDAPWINVAGKKLDLYVDGVLFDSVFVKGVTTAGIPPSPTNQTPQVNAGPDQTVTLPSPAMLSGTATDDGLPSGSTFSVYWSKISGLGTVTFGNTSSRSTTASFSTSGTYVLRLTASDSTLSASDDISIVVKSQPPIITTVGGRVETTDTVNVRRKPSISGKSQILGAQPNGSLGTIISGPSTANGYTWWQVDFDTGADGFVAGAYLVPIAP